MKNLKRIHYDFNNYKPVCGVRGQIYITSEKFYVTCKACLNYLNDVKKMVLEDKKSFANHLSLIKTVNVGQHWRKK